MSFSAKYPGLCVECGQSIRPGDEVEWDSSRTLVHVNCEEPDHEPVQVVGRQCPVCHLTMPLTGVCDDCAA